MRGKNNLPLMTIVSVGFIVAIASMWTRSNRPTDRVDLLLYGGMFAAAVILLLLVLAEWIFPSKQPPQGEGAVKGSVEERIESGRYAVANVRGGEVFVLEEAIVFISETARYDAGLGTYTRQSSHRLIFYSVIISAVVVGYAFLIGIWTISLIYVAGFAWFLIRELGKGKKPFMVVYPKAHAEPEVRSGYLYLSALRDGTKVADRYPILPSEAETFRMLIGRTGSGSGQAT